MSRKVLRKRSWNYKITLSSPDIRRGVTEVMASDPIHPLPKEEQHSADEKNAQHIEISQIDLKLGSGSEEWKELKPKLNLQMALAFVVSVSLKDSAARGRSASRSLGSRNIC